METVIEKLKFKEILGIETLEELHKVISGKEYTTDKYGYDYYIFKMYSQQYVGFKTDYKEAQAINNIQKLSMIFDEYMKRKHKIPPIEGYIELYVKIAKDYFENVLGIPFTEGHKYSFENRGYNTYISKMVEIDTAYKIDYSYKDSEIYMDDYIDYFLGVDIILNVNGKLVYIHITKDSKHARNLIKIKEGRTGFYYNGAWVKHCLHRDFSKHIALYYSTNNVNKHVILDSLMNTEYINNEITKALNNNKYEIFNSQSQLAKFEDFLHKLN